MDLWRILVFAVVKQCLDLDYDALLYRANHDLLLRKLLGHGDAEFDAVEYTRQRLVDNVQLLTPELIGEVIGLIVRTGHKVAGKKCGAALRGRCDSRVVKTNVHFPTDVSLLWDAVRGLIRTKMPPVFRAGASMRTVHVRHTWPSARCGRRGATGLTRRA